mgnify:CR=1 FL=1
MKRILIIAAVFGLAATAASADILYFPSEYKAVVNDRDALQIELDTTKNQFRDAKRDLESKIASLNAKVESLDKQLAEAEQHAGPPPVGPNQRRTLYLPFYGPETLRLLGPYQSFEQILPGFGTGKIPSLDEVARKQGANV